MLQVLYQQQFVYKIIVNKQKTQNIFLWSLSIVKPGNYEKQFTMMLDVSYQFSDTKDLVT